MAGRVFELLKFCYIGGKRDLLRGHYGAEVVRQQGQAHMGLQVEVMRASDVTAGAGVASKQRARKRVVDCALQLYGCEE